MLGTNSKAMYPTPITNMIKSAKIRNILEPLMETAIKM